MKLKLIYTLFAFSALALLFLNNSAGPAEVQGQDRTGSPLSIAPCQACHSSGAFSPTPQLQVLDNTAPVTTYEPGKLYKVRVTVNASGDPAGYGFQTVALSGTGNVQAGDFMNPGADVQITPLNGREYPEHNKRSSTNTFEVDWEAPAAGTGEVRFYAAVVAANGMNGSDGDGSSFLSSPITLTEAVSSTTEANELFEAFTIFPNPVSNELNLRIQSPSQSEYQLRLLDIQGRTALSRPIALSTGEQVHSLDVSQLPAGVYTLQITDGKRVSSRKVVKR